MAFDLVYGRRIYGFWGRHPSLYWAADWPLFVGNRAEIRKEMLAAARWHARGEGWQNVEFVQGDAARTELPAESFDAALCTLGLSVIPDHQAAIARVRAALKGGGRFVVLDSRPGPLRGRGRLLNPALKPLFKYAYNADVDKDLVPDLERAFDAVAVEEFNGGSLFIAAARKDL